MVDYDASEQSLPSPLSMPVTAYVGVLTYRVQRVNSPRTVSSIANTDPTWTQHFFSFICFNLRLPEFLLSIYVKNMEKRKNNGMSAQ